MPGYPYSDEQLRSLIARARTIAVVGLSAAEHKASYQVAAYLKAHGFWIIPVNPTLDSVLAEKAYPSLDDVPEPVDIVDVFRPGETILPIVQAALRRKFPVLWLQLGIHNQEAENLARTAGLTVVTDRCLMIEHRRLFS
ncbi:CoA-binding protein [Gelria sp. Kuro-4]|uniref:CoA-binding protein n=1 Tax=Gelria sp. Kuro-4 TaxID=2796927 RepID=UPI001BEDB64D|nr:CoA-binding protein [Gelria sp. Kuro-4]BCV24620.1 CoA-binding protein [Gelria sp. Kuro-4]